MLHSRAQTTPLFRTSLRDWQANFKARQPGQSETVSAPATPTANLAPPRVKRLAARKKKKMREAAMNASR